MGLWWSCWRVKMGGVEIVKPRKVTSPNFCMPFSNIIIILPIYHSNRNHVPVTWWEICPKRDVCPQKGLLRTLLNSIRTILLKKKSQGPKPHLLKSLGTKWDIKPCEYSTISLLAPILFEEKKIIITASIEVWKTFLELSICLCSLNFHKKKMGFENFHKE